MSSSKDDPSAVLETRDSHPEVEGLPSSQGPQRPGGGEDGTLGQDNRVSTADNLSVPTLVQDQITAPSGKGTRTPRKSVKASLQSETSPGDTPSVSTSASLAKPAKRTSKNSKKPGADSLKNGGPAAATTFRFISGDNTLGPQAVSEGSISLTGVPPETHERVALLGSAEHLGTSDPIAQPTNLPRKRGRRKAATTPSNTLPPQDGSTSVSVKEEQATTLSAVSFAPKKTKKPLKEQKTWKVVSNSSESMHRSWQPSNLQSVIAPDSGQHSKRYSIPRIWTSDKTELQASILGPAKGVNGISWTHSHTPFVVLDDGPRTTRPVDLVQLDTRLKDEFVFDLVATRTLVTVGGSAKANIAEPFEPILVVDVGMSTLPSISTSSKQVHFAEGTKEDDGPTPPSAEDASAIAAPTLSPSPPAKDTSMTPETRDLVLEPSAASLEQPNITPSLAPQEPHDVPAILENPIHRIHHFLDRVEQNAQKLASDVDVTFPLRHEGQGELESRCSMKGGEGSGLTKGSEGSAAAQPVPEVEEVVVPDKSMDIDIDDEPPPPGMSSPLTELSSDDEETEADDVADMMDVDVDQSNPSLSIITSASSSSSKVRTLPCGCGKTWVYTDCEEHHRKGGLSASVVLLTSEETNDSQNRPKRKAAVQTSLRIQDQTKKQHPRRSKAEAKMEEARVKAEEVEVVLANAAQPETKSEPEPKEKGRDATEKGTDVPAVESPVVSVNVKVAKHSKRQKVKADAPPIPEGGPENTISSRLSTLRKRKVRGEDEKEAAPEAEETLPLPSSRKRRRENAANEQVVVVPPAMAEGDASSSSSTLLESAAQDGQLALAPCTEPSEAVVESQLPEVDVSQPAHVSGVTDTSTAIASPPQPEMEPQSASAITSAAFSSEPVVDANVPSDVIMVEADASLAKDNPPPTPATEPTPPTVPGETRGPADKSNGEYDPSLHYLQKSAP